jgi:hypothetical protein
MILPLQNMSQPQMDWKVKLWWNSDLDERASYQELAGQKRDPVRLRNARLLLKLLRGLSSKPSLLTSKNLHPLEMPNHRVSSQRISLAISGSLAQLLD